MRKHFDTILSRFRSTSRTNKKRKAAVRGQQSFALYYTLGISIALHIIVIYAIPSVNVFSAGAESSDQYVVDIIHEEAAEPTSSEETDVIAAENVPEVQPVREPDVASQNMPADIDMEIPNIAKVPALPENQPEWQHADSTMPPLKRSPSVEDARLANPLLDQRRVEKLPVAPPMPDIAESQLSAEALDKPAAVPTAVDRNREDDTMQFPLRKPVKIAAPREGSHPEEVPLIKRQAAPVNETLFASRIGLTPRDANDTNRFGIFAGETTPLRQKQETIVEEPIREDRKKAALPEDVAETAKALEIETTASQIEGPLRGRKLIRRPPPPRVNVDIAVELRLKFWVLPDGTIGDVIPMKRGDVKLERIAVAYVKTWKFEPLPSSAAQQQIWGTIPIRFTVR